MKIGLGKSNDHKKNGSANLKAVLLILVKNIMPNFQTGEMFFALPAQEEKCPFSRNSSGDSVHLSNYFLPADSIVIILRRFSSSIISEKASRKWQRHRPNEKEPFYTY